METIGGKTAGVVLTGLAAEAAASQMTTAMAAPGVLTVTRKSVPRRAKVLAVAGILLGVASIWVADGAGPGMISFVLALCLFARQTEAISVAARDVDGGARVSAQGMAKPETWAVLREMVSAIKTA